MKELTKIQRWLFMIGGALMVLGAGLHVFMWNQPIVCWEFLLGAVFFASMQIAQAYMGNSLVIKRLKNIMTLAALFFIIAGLLMVDNAYRSEERRVGKECRFRWS